MNLDAVSIAIEQTLMSSPSPRLFACDELAVRFSCVEPDRRPGPEPPALWVLEIAQVEGTDGVGPVPTGLVRWRVPSGGVEFPEGVRFELRRDHIAMIADAGWEAIRIRFALSEAQFDPLEGALRLVAAAPGITVDFGR